VPPAPDDWRRAGQERFLVPGTTFVRRAYRSYSDTWDHDHCAFCHIMLLPAENLPTTDDYVTSEGYATTDDYVRGAEYEWICVPCFDDFAAEFGFRVVEPG
jgi:hypothetical protein